MFDQMALRIERLEKQLGLSSGIELIKCRICSQIKHQPMTQSWLPNEVCGDCIEKERKNRAQLIENNRQEFLARSGKENRDG